jgi:lipopolysaccharide export system permease protein
MKLIDRYILRELVGPFLFGVAVVILLFEGSILFPLIETIVAKQVPLSLVGRILLLKVPYLLVWAAPVAMLFAAALAMNRMGRENEITCMRSAGTSLMRVFAPILATGLVVSGITFWMGEVVVPRAETIANQLVRRMYLEQTIPQILPDTFFRTDNYCFYTREAQRKPGKSKDVIVKDILIYRLPMDGTLPTLISAKEGESNGMKWVFRNGWQAELDRHGFFKTNSQFPKLELDLARAIQDFWVNQRSPEEMNLQELREQIDQLGGAQANFASYAGDQPLASVVVDYHLRLSIPLSCFIFALLSAPLSLRFARAGGFWGILLSIVLGFLYYNTIFLGKILGANQVIPAVLAGWMQDIIFGALGLLLIAREP